MTIEDSILILFKPWLLGYCNCHCGKEVVYNHRGKQNKYIHGHHVRGKFGLEHNNWKGGRNKNHGYWEMWMPDYYRARKHGKVSEHIYFYEQYHKCCILKWVDVHHIDGNTDNNMPWNLILLSHSKHSKLTNKNIVHPKKDMSNRVCCKCGSKTTYVNKKGWKLWYGNKKDGWVCTKCYTK